MRTILVIAALFVGACYATHFENGELPCSTEGECPDGYSCQAEHCFTVDTPGQVGQPCASSAQCISGLCNGRWCTQPCRRASECPAGAVCATARDGNGYCFPGCQSNAGCRIYGADVSCASGTGIGGNRVSGCSVTN